MNSQRRAWLKASAAAAAWHAGATLGAPKGAAAMPSGGLNWVKSLCRYCSTGCGVLAGVQDGRIVGIQGDPDHPVNRGLLCVKGYYLAPSLYGADRLTRPLLRQTKGKYDKHGEFATVSWSQALAIMAQKWRESLTHLGPTGVALLGSGQWTLWEAFAASKLWHAGLRSNQIDSSARNGAASIAASELRTFGTLGPIGSFDDIEHADTLVLWGVNLAETFPVLWSRITDHRLSRRETQVLVLSTVGQRTFDLADQAMLIAPQSELAILNYLCQELFRRGLIDPAFAARHFTFRKGVADIGQGLRSAHPLERHALHNGLVGLDGRRHGDPGEAEPISLEEFARFVSEYTLEHTARICGLGHEMLQTLANVFIDPGKRVLSLWGMGVSQHARGTWANHLLLNLHLLSGKFGEPGSGALALPGQPSARGSIHEVGIAPLHLPAGMSLALPEHRARAEKLWRLPSGTLHDTPGLTSIELARALKDGAIGCLWVMGSNALQSGPNLLDEAFPGWRHPRSFVVVSEAYPTVSALAADLILPSAMWVEKEGAYGNADRRTQFWGQLVSPPGEARSDLWQLIEFAKRLRAQDAWPEALRRRAGRGPGTRLFDLLFRDGVIDGFPTPRYRNDEARACGFHVQRGLFEEYAAFGRGRGYDLAPFAFYAQGQSARWPAVDERESAPRHRVGDPHHRAGGTIRFHGWEDGRARIYALPYQPSAETVDKDFDLNLCTGHLLEHWHTGSLTRRVPQLHRALPEALLYMHPEDARTRGLQPGMLARIMSRRGAIEARVETRGRIKPPRGQVFLPYFDERRLVNKLTLDANCPISRAADFKKCAVRVTRA